MRAFTRQLGSQPGVQLNPVRDQSEGFAPDQSDQVFAVAMRATRGRIDRPFRVNRGNALLKLGPGESIRLNALNEAKVQVFEALNNGAAEAVVHRLVPAAAAIKFIVATAIKPVKTATTISAQASDNSFNDSANGFLTAGFKVGMKVASAGFTGEIANNSPTGRVITAVTAGKMTFGGADGNDIVDDASGESVTLTALSGTGYGDVEFSVSDSAPVAPHLFYFKHLACHNDGIRTQLHADAVQEEGDDVSTKLVSLKVRSKERILLLDVVGSFDPAALDDAGQSIYLPDIVAATSQDPDFELTVAANAAIEPSSNAYGRDADTGLNKIADSGVLVAFVEGGTTYTNADYIKARERLTATEHDYGYIAAAGNTATGLIAQLAQLAYDTNRQFRFDVDGKKTPAEAITYVAGLNLDSHYCHAFWSPNQSDDPLNGGKAVIGTSALNVAYACRRNAVTDNNGFARKNQPVAGREFPVSRTGMKQLYSPSEAELSDLAKAKINPVLFERYGNGSAFVFTDSLTQARTETSLRKLISTAEMSSSLDEQIARYAKEVLQQPMNIALRKLDIFMQKLFENAETAGWLVPAQELGGASFKFSNKPNALRSTDAIDVRYQLRYDGVARQISVEQTIVK